MSADVLRCFPQDGTMKAFDRKFRSTQEMEASFSVKLLPIGFLIGKPLEQGKALPPVLEATDLLYPYTRTSEFFLRALDGGCIPAGLLDDIPCKYVNGCVVCEVLDYCVNAPASSDDCLLPKASVDWPPVVYKITLRPTMESIVKDISSLVDENWTYNDLMEVESRILKTALPQLDLHPRPSSSQVEDKATAPCHLRSGTKIFKSYQSNKRGLLDRRMRLAASAKAMVKASGLDHGKRISFGIIPERLTGQANLENATNRDIAGLNNTSTGTFGSAVHEAAGLFTNSKFSILGKRNYHSLVTDQQALDLRPENTSDFVKLEAQYHDMSLDQRRLGDSILSDHSNSDLQFSSQRPSQANFERSPNMPSQSWQVLSPSPMGDNKHDDILHRRKALASPKLNGRASTPSSFSNDAPPMMSQGAMHSLLGSSAQPSITPSSSSGIAQPLDRAGVSGPVDSTPPVQHQSIRRRASSLPKNATSVAGVASPGSTGNSGGISNINSPSTASIPPVPMVKNETLLVPGQRKEPIDNFMAIMSVAQRYGLAAKKRKVEQLPEVKKTSPSWQLLIVALANTSSEEIKDPKGQRNMADSLVGGSVNVRKTRFLQFQRQINHGGGNYRRIRPRLVMCERAKDAMVEAVVYCLDDQDDETLVPHHVLPTMANAHAADTFARQFCAIMEKEGYELVDDQVQPTMPRGNPPANVVSTNRPLPTGASSLGNGLGHLSSPRSIMNHMPAMGMVGSGMPASASTHSGLATARMPPPGNRQLSASSLGQAGVNSYKPLQLDGAASQLTAGQHAHLQPQPLTQRAQSMVMPGQLPQLGHHTINPQMVPNQGQIQHLLNQRQQQAQNVALQRKLMGMGGLGTMGSLGGMGANQGGLGNMVGLNNVVGMGGMNNVSASMAGISGLNNVGHMPGIVAMGQNTGLNTMGQNTGLSNLIGQQIRPNSLHQQMAALNSKAAQMQGGGRITVDSLTGMNAANQVQHMSAGLPMLSQSLSRMGRVGLTPIQRAPSAQSIGSPKVATSSVAAVAAAAGGQSLYVNSQQLTAQQQLNLQQVSSSNPQQQLNLLQQHQQPPPQTPQQLLNVQTPLISQPQQSIINSHGQASPASQQLNSQLSSQQLVVGGLGSIVGGPASPQLSSQSLGSVSGASLDPPMANQAGQ